MPITDSYGQNITYPTLADKPNAQTLGQGIVDGLTPKVIMNFASAVVRGATITSPKAGMVTWLVDVARLEFYDGTAWRLFEDPQIQTYNSAVNLASHLTNYFSLNLGGQLSSNVPGMWNGANPTRLVAPTAGTYAVDGLILWQGSLGNQDGRAEFRMNGSSVGSNTARFTTMHGSNGNAASTASGVLVFGAPGYAEVFANQNTGSTVTLTVAVGMKRISMATA